MYNLAHDNLISNDVYTSGLAYLNNAYNSRLNSINKKSSSGGWLNDLGELLFGTSRITNAEESLRQQARARGLI